MRRDPLVTHIYAEALYSAAKKFAATLVLCDQARTLLDTLRQNPNLRTFLEGPHIPVAAKKDLAEKLFRPRFHALLTELFFLLLRKGRIDYLRDVLERYQLLVQMEQGIYPANITTAQELTPTEKLAIKNSVERFTGKQLTIQYVVDSSILGGTIFSAQDLLIDDSLRRHLDRLRSQLTAVTVH
jgi:F-type H+-transporting ATPase subunit delta